MAKSEKFGKKTSSVTNIVVTTGGTIAESARTLADLSELANRVGEARLLLNHWQCVCALTHLTSFSDYNNIIVLCISEQEQGSFTHIFHPSQPPPP